MDQHFYNKLIRQSLATAATPSIHKEALLHAGRCHLSPNSEMTSKACKSLLDSGKCAK